MNDKEKKAIEYLKVRLYGNEECKYIDVAQEDLIIFLKLVTRKEKELESWKKYCDEQEENITEKNNKICDLEFKIENQKAEIEEKDKSLKLHTKLEYQYKNDYLNVIEDLKKKDKQIDLMAEDKYENINMIQMANIGKEVNYDPTKLFNGIPDEEAIKIIKQYYEKKAEEDK